VRRRGEDVAEGAVALRKGSLLRPGEIGVAASLGRARLRVIRRPRVALLASGDELVDVHGYAEVLAGKRIVSSNSYSVAAQIREAGGMVVDLGIAADEPESIRQLLAEARGCDALVTVAGMSVGEHDHMIAVLAELDTEVAFWRVRMRPGSPFAFGTIGSLDGIPWFGLPGNPVSAVVTCELFVRPALVRMAGAERVFPPAIEVRAADVIEGGTGLTRFHRVRLRYVPDGPPYAQLTGSQGSGILTSTVEADALLVIEAARERVDPGDTLPAILLGGHPLQSDPGHRT
jgi:molybdopterin molybdotransferase